MPLVVTAVVIRASSKNQIPGSRPRHAPASMPPLTMGTSTDLPVRLSVIVIDSSATSLSLTGEAVHVGLSQLEAEPLVQPVGRVPRGARRQLDGSGPEVGGMVDGGAGERRSHALAL